nr:MAG TPA: hypothetical protein [Caudoviricetes sp.]
MEPKTCLVLHQKSILGPRRPSFHSSTYKHLNKSTGASAPQPPTSFICYKSK